MYTRILSLIICCSLVPLSASAGMADRPVQSQDFSHPEVMDSTPPSAAGYSTNDSLKKLNAPLMLLAQSDLAQQVSRENPGYLESITDEAVQTDHGEAVQSEAVDRPAPANTAPSGAAKSDGTRSKAIRSIVSEALAGSTVNKVETKTEQIAQPAAKPHRQRLQEAVSSAPPPKVDQHDDYLSILKDEVSTTVVLKKSETAPVKTTSTAGQAAQQAKSSDLYTVRYGDSLWKVAAKVYGDGHRWVTIYDANRHRIATADILTVGQILSIPRD